MASFEICVRSTNKEYNQVYIRVIHKGKPGYIKTSILASKKQLKGSIVKDLSLRILLANQIKQYVTKINAIDIRFWEIQKLIEYLKMDTNAISFSDFFNKYMVQMSKDGRDNPAKNYGSAITSLKKFMSGETDRETLKKFNINFSDLRQQLIMNWIKSLEHTARAKNLYPYLIKTVFEAGLEQYNDYENDIILIKNRPFRKGMIPDSDVAKKRAVDKDILLKIFNANTQTTDIRASLAKDVAKLIFFLGGINTVDLYNLKHENYSDGKLKYNRHKTTEKRKDKAYIEITVPEEITYLLKKYKGKTNLFDFSTRYTDSNSFNRNVNIGLKHIKRDAAIEENISTYTFRHSWGTIAKNKCGASMELVAFSLNHASAHKEAELYVQKDFSPIDILNRKVIDFVFAK